MATEMSSRLTTQILMLYYVLTYQDCLLSNMKSLGRVHVHVLLTIPGIYIPGPLDKRFFISLKRFFSLHDLLKLYLIMRSTG